MYSHLKSYIFFYELNIARYLRNILARNILKALNFSRNIFFQPTETISVADGKIINAQTNFSAVHEILPVDIFIASL